MDSASSVNWGNLPKCPSLKNLTDGTFGRLKESQEAAVQDLTKAHIESFDQAVTDRLNLAVQVSRTLKTHFYIVNARHENGLKCFKQMSASATLLFRRI